MECGSESLVAAGLRERGRRGVVGRARHKSSEEFCCKGKHEIGTVSRGGSAVFVPPEEALR